MLGKPSIKKTIFLLTFIKIKQLRLREFNKIQEILSKIGTEFFKINEEMAEKNKAEDGSSISLKSSYHMK